MKTLLRIFTILAIILFVGIYSNGKQDDAPILKGPETNEPQLGNEDSLSGWEEPSNVAGPQKGIASFINKSAEELVAQLGEPDRIDPSAYNYEWWIYYLSEQSYLQVGIERSKVVTIYATGSEADIQPFKIGQTVNEIYKDSSVESEIVVNVNEGTYRFELSEEDLNTRMLTSIGDVYAQLYLDKFTSKLVSIRFFNKETLVEQRPYEMVYRGDLMEENDIPNEEWDEISRGSEQQIFDITNILRSTYEAGQVDWDEETAMVAEEHSKDMFEQDYFSHESPTFGTLADRLESAEIAFGMAGENIAAQYADGPAAVHGWLNSEGHRKTLLEPDFTHLGVGVYRKYYTQNFIQQFD
ncbi:CAP domain-containing protein [Bacillus sp. SCS-153A]|uniref:CAP domain-containing protein n=1 Tax=Rossellomorea sedimentorum TaxID=3115294 RepID=UPI0039063979